jgi:hypothetical protein
MRKGFEGAGRGGFFDGIHEVFERDGLDETTREHFGKTPIAGAGAGGIRGG